jgi:hypothetical protein
MIGDRDIIPISEGRSQETAQSTLPEQPVEAPTEATNTALKIFGLVALCALHTAIRLNDVRLLKPESKLREPVAKARGGELSKQDKGSERTR